MHVCYLDESGVTELTGTSHFVLLGLAIPDAAWKACDAQVQTCLQPFGLQNQEVHTAWMLRRYVEQEQVRDFAQLPWDDRRRAAQQRRDAHLLALAAQGRNKQLRAAQKNYRKTAPYLHLTQLERQSAVRALADLVGGWSEARLLAEVIDKRFFYAQRGTQASMIDFAFTEFVQRFEYFLANRGKFLNAELMGMIVQDNNQTVERRLTDMMRRIHDRGTRWTNIPHIIETPLFVDSELTRMVQLADICAYATRRFFENQDRDLFDRIYSRFDRAGPAVVGVRHFADPACGCQVCRDHRPARP